MTEERWHNFAKEKPSEDMEGRNFIVSNGHYEKIATWYGYWDNEPFMGDRLCDEVVGWKFYFTPEEEKANEATRTEPKPMKCDELKQVENPIEWGLYYDKSEVDAAIAELKARIQLDDDEMAGFLDLEEECGGGDLRNYITELKRKLEDAEGRGGGQMSELKEGKCFYCENPSGPSCNSQIDCWPYEAQVIGREVRIQTTDDQTVNICTIRGIKFCPMCGRKL